MRIINLIFLIIIVFLGVSFSVLNAELVNVNYYIGDLKLPLSLLLVLTLGLGLLAGFLAFSLKFLKLKREHRRLKSKMQLVQKEVDNLRAIPLKDDI